MSLGEGAALSRPPDITLNQRVAAVLDGTLLSVIFVDFDRYPSGIRAVDGTDFVGGFTPVSSQHIAAEITAPPLPADLQLIRSTTLTHRG